MENDCLLEPSHSNMESDQPQKIPYPKRVFLIIGNEFCERFNFYGMKGLLYLYLKDTLSYGESHALLLANGFSMMVYFMCIFGGIVSDVWLGKFKTILILSIVYSIGSIIVSASAIPVLSSQHSILIIGLLLIAIGSGGIKPCVSAFGGDQFKMPEQAAQMATFFSLFYFSINAGSLLSLAIMPILKKDVHCFGEDTCYSLAFGVPAVLMLIAVVLFVSGKPTYTCEKTSSENMLLQVIKCITNAIRTKIRERRTNPRRNMLDYSIDKYGSKLVNETRVLLKILVLYLPLPFFWALYDQQGTLWMNQAKAMDRTINTHFGSFTIITEQMQMINPLLILTFIPLFEAVVYPVLSKIGIRRPLQKMALGGLFAALAFLISAFVQFKIDASPEKSVNILWFIPQNVVMSMGEVLFAVTGLSFSYEQAPESMKSVVQSFWLLTIAFGDVIMTVIQQLKFDSQGKQFLLFSGLMVVDMLIFMILARKYKSSNRIVPEILETEMIFTDDDNDILN